MGQKLSEAELLERLTEAAKLVTVGAEYIHYKNKPYRVIDLVILEATNEICVVYQPLYGAKLIFVRPVVDWVENVTVEGKTVKRFAKV